MWMHRATQGSWRSGTRTAQQQKGAARMPGGTRGRTEPEPGATTQALRKHRASQDEPTSAPGTREEREQSEGHAGPALGSSGSAWPCSRTVMAHASAGGRSRPPPRSAGCARDAGWAGAHHWAARASLTSLKGNGEPAAYCSSVTPQPSDFFNVPKKKQGERKEKWEAWRLRPPCGTSSPGPCSSLEAGSTGHSAPSTKPQGLCEEGSSLHVAEASSGGMTSQSFQNESPSSLATPKPRSTHQSFCLPPAPTAGGRAAGWLTWHRGRQQAGDLGRWRKENPRRRSHSTATLRGPSQVCGGSSASPSPSAHGSVANAGQESGITQRHGPQLP